MFQEAGPQEEEEDGEPAEVEPPLPAGWEKHEGKPDSRHSWKYVMNDSH